MLQITIDDFVTRMLYLGDLQSQYGADASGERHETAEVFREVNASHRALRDLAIERGFDWLVDSTDPAALPAVDTNRDWRVIPWTTSFQAVVGVDVRMNTSREGWVKLQPADLAQRLQFRHHTLSDGPMAYIVRNIPTRSESGEILLVPSGNGSGQYVVHFVPSFADLTTGQAFVFPSGAWVDWQLADSLLRIIGLRDGDNQGRIQAALDMRKNAADQIGRPAQATVPEARIVELLPMGYHGDGFKDRDWGA